MPNAILKVVLGAVLIGEIYAGTSMAQTLTVDGKSYLIENQVLSSPNIKHGGHVLLNGIFSEMGIFQYSNEEAYAAGPGDLYSGVVAGMGVRELAVEGDQVENRCWEPIRFKLYDVSSSDSSTDNSLANYRVIEFEKTDCPSAVSLPEKVVLTIDYEYFAKRNASDHSDDGYSNNFTVYMSTNSAFSVKIFEIAYSEFVVPAELRFANEIDLIRAVGHERLEYGQQPFSPDQACAIIDQSDSKEFIDLLKEVPEVWWFNNPWQVSVGKDAYNAVYEEGMSISNAIERFSSGEIQRPYQVFEMNDICVDVVGTGMSSEVFQIQSYPFAFSAMVDRLKSADLGLVMPMNFATAGGSSREFFSVGGRNIVDESGEVESEALGAVIEEALLRAAIDPSSVEILNDHPFGVPFAYSFELSGYGSAISGNATRWEAFKVEASLALGANSIGNREALSIDDLVLSVGFPTTRVRVRRESDPPPNNLEDGFSEVTEDEAFRRYLLRVKSEFCLLTGCGLSSAEMDDIEQEWIRNAN